MEMGTPMERRKHRRYILRGRVQFRIDSLEVWAELVNFGQGGMLIQTRFPAPEKIPINYRVLAFGYPDSCDVSGKVVGGQGSLLAIQFLERTAGAQQLLSWLDREHYPWTGGGAVDGEQRGELLQAPALNSAHPVSEAEAEAALESIFREA